MTPQLRFSQFTDEWQVEKLGDIFDVRDGTHESPQYFESGKPLITSKNLQPDGRLDLNNVSYISQVDFENINRRSKVHVGDVLFGMIGTIGNPVRVLSDNFAIKNVALIKPKSLPTEYLIQYLNSPIITKQFHQKNAGGTQKFIALGDIRLLNIGIASKPEQEKIADFLTAVDERIGKIEKKLELLQQYKKGVMQKIFTQQIRFKDEDGNLYPEWIEKKLGSLCQIAKSGGTPTATNRSYYNNGNIPFLAISDITEQGKYLTRTSKFINESGLKNSASWIVPVGSLIYSMYASVGFVSINKIPMATSQAVINLVPNSQVSVEFLYYFLSDYKRKVHRFIETGTQGNLNAQTVKNIPVSLPYSEEQQKIAIFLAALDDKIKAEQTRLAAAKQWKKGLLQRMFV